jgi:hypothetical protein
LAPAQGNEVLKDEVLELDELWSFVAHHKKAAVRCDRLRGVALGDEARLSPDEPVARYSEAREQLE